MAVGGGGWWLWAGHGDEESGVVSRLWGLGST